MPNSRYGTVSRNRARKAYFRGSAAAKRGLPKRNPYRNPILAELFNRGYDNAPAKTAKPQPRRLK